MIKFEIHYAPFSREWYVYYVTSSSGGMQKLPLSEIITYVRNKDIFEQEVQNRCLIGTIHTRDGIKSFDIWDDASVMEIVLKYADV